MGLVLVPANLGGCGSLLLTNTSSFGRGAIGGPYMIYNTTGFSGVELPDFESVAGKKTFDANQFKTRQ